MKYALYSMEFCYDKALEFRKKIEKKKKNMYYNSMELL